MGRDKAAIAVDGEILAVRTAKLLLAVAAPCLEIGGQLSGLRSARETRPGQGPLSAIAAGWSALRSAGQAGPVLVVATDMPRLTHGALAWLARSDSALSVVPVTGGRMQFLCARWSVKDLDRAVELVEAGERKVAAVFAGSVTLVDESAFPPGVEAMAFADADTPEDLDRLTHSP
jgi:molybdopterin-guanine dinucleotide biosynthesis protein A